MKKTLLLLVALLTFTAQQASAQENPLKIVTQHPDLRVKVKRCAASDKTVILDLVVTNTGDQDVTNVTFAASGGIYCEAYDDEGNRYSQGTFKVKVANGASYEDYYDNYRMVAGVPIKVSYRIEGVSTTAEYLAFVELGINSEALGIGASTNKWVTIRNIPIARD